MYSGTYTRVLDRAYRHFNGLMDREVRTLRVGVHAYDGVNRPREHAEFPEAASRRSASGLPFE
jgi:hypothetical protein